MAIRFGRLLSRYSLVVFLPTFVAGTIYADYSHTQKYKAEVKKRQKENEAAVLHQ